MFHLVKLNKDLNGELRAEGATGDHLVERLGETHADGGPPVELEGCHGRYLQEHTSAGIIYCHYHHSQLLHSPFGTKMRGLVRKGRKFMNQDKTFLFER